MNKRFLIWLFVFLVGMELVKAEGLSGSLSLAGLQAPADDSIAEITATGIGLDGNAAEKQAIISAVQQAVGMYADTKTITENEQVIKDRILTLSNGFVKEYKVVTQANRRADGLYEITILAKVQKGQIVAKLKEINLIKGEVAGQNLYAQNMTQMLSAQDAVKMLDEKLPELAVNCIKMEFVDKEGQPRSSAEPVEQIRDDQSQKVRCTWYVKTSVDKAFYSANLYPMLKRCLDAIFSGASEEMALNNTDAAILREHPNDPNAMKTAKESLAMRTLGEYKPWNASYGHGRKDIFLIKSSTRTGDHCIGTLYSGKSYLLKGKDDPEPLSDGKIRRWPPPRSGAGALMDPYSNLASFLDLKILSKTGDLVAMGESKISDSFNPTRQILGPFVSYENHDDGTPFLSILFKGEEITPISCEIAISDLKDVGKIEASVKTPKYELVVYPVGRKN